jgi:uncharacterized 2Fe-2S/4Fe-4S cluster protein (DUF4445 family)
LSASSTKKTGIAIDIGTTTLAAALASAETGSPLKTISAPNPQASYGADVLERINAVKADPAALEDLSACLRKACNDLIGELSPDEPPTSVTVAGNSIMEHFFLGLSPLCMAEVPYKPLFKEARTLAAGEAPLNVAPRGGVYVFPLIGGFVGGDTVAAALALGMRDEEANTLMVDIGTNSEIILKARGRLFATSAAAGPAFEAAGITHGMTAATGAISDVEVEDGALRLTVIGGVIARGICGSGLLAAVSALLRAGVIDPTGRIRSADEIDSNLATRIKPDEKGNSFILQRSARGAITLTQEDIRALQVAKAAIRAGISTLLKKAGIDAGDIGKVHVAGAFGSNLSVRGLLDVGLMDPLWADNLHFAGDAALEGAALALVEEKKDEAQWIAANTTYQPLSGGKAFEKEFIEEMNFPSTFF